MVNVKLTQKGEVVKKQLESPHLVPELIFAILVITPHATVTSYLRVKVSVKSSRKSESF